MMFPAPYVPVNVPNGQPRRIFCSPYIMTLFSRRQVIECLVADFVVVQRMVFLCSLDKEEGLNLWQYSLGMGCYNMG